MNIFINTIKIYLFFIIKITKIYTMNQHALDKIIHNCSLKEDLSNDEIKNNLETISKILKTMNTDLKLNKIH